MKKVLLVLFYFSWNILFPNFVDGSCCTISSLTALARGSEYRCDIKVRSSEFWNQNNRWEIKIDFNTTLIASIGEKWSKGSAQCIKNSTSPLSYICTGQFSSDFYHSFMLIQNNQTSSPLDATSDYIRVAAYDEVCRNVGEELCPEYPPTRIAEQKSGDDVSIPGTSVSIKKTILIVCISVGAGCLAIVVVVILVSQRRKNEKMASEIINYD
jgi:hypothetical protein